MSAESARPPFVHDTPTNAVVLAELGVSAVAEGVVVNYAGQLWLRNAGVWAAIAGAGDLLAANNLNDVANAAAAAHNLGLGTADSPTFTGLTLTGNALTLPGLSNKTIAFTWTGFNQVVIGSATRGSNGDSLRLGGSIGAPLIDLQCSGVSNIGFFGAVPVPQPAAATDVVEALISLGLLAEGETWPLNLGTGALTAGTVAHGTHAFSQGAGAYNIDASLGDVQVVTLTANAGAPTITNPVVGQDLTLEFVQDGTGGRTYSWPANWVWNGSAITASTAPGVRDSATARYDGANWQVMAAAPNGTFVQTSATADQSVTKSAVGGHDWVMQVIDSTPPGNAESTVRDVRSNGDTGVMNHLDRWWYFNNTTLIAWMDIFGGYYSNGSISLLANNPSVNGMATGWDYPLGTMFRSDCDLGAGAAVAALRDSSPPTGELLGGVYPDTLAESFRLATSGGIYSGGPNTGQITKPGAPTVAVGAAGVLTGAYTYKVTFVTADGETDGGTTSATVNPVAQKVSLTAIPTGAAGTIARRIYRTLAGGANNTQQLCGIISDNTTTTFTDNRRDFPTATGSTVGTVRYQPGGLGHLVPQVNTTRGGIFSRSLISAGSTGFEAIDGIVEVNASANGNGTVQWRYAGVNKWLAYLDAGGTGSTLHLRDVANARMLAEFVAGNSSLNSRIDLKATLKFNDTALFQTTVGAAGAGAAVPLTATKYLQIQDSAGTVLVIPCFAAA